ncbi:MAG: hypothetical protein KDD36_05705 [Flavobacteriales bacterium]|nr:hypothetical protein [Flavobacteriales bacterium]
MLRNHRNLYFTLAFAGLALAACNKEEVDSETQSATDNSMAETEFAMVFSTSNNIVIREPGTKKILNECYTITAPDTTDPWPRVLTIDFGTGCLGDDGRLRSGQIKVTITGPWNEYKSQITAELVNYYVNLQKHTGTLTAINQTAPGANTRTFDINVDNASIVTDQGTIQWESSRTIEWLSGFDTDTVKTDDIFEVTGSANGTNRKGKTYEVKVTSPIRMDGSCDWITSGVLELTPEGLSTRTVDFGDKTCDNKATVTIKGKSYEITMQ